jgi:hypothetical protein
MQFQSLSLSVSFCAMAGVAGAGVSFNDLPEVQVTQQSSMVLRHMLQSADL